MSDPGCCPPAVTFVYADWIAAYPEFDGATGAVSSPLATTFFNQATLILRNCLVRGMTVAMLTQYLYMLTSHIAWLRGYGVGNSGAGGGPRPVGRISNASEGSVSVGLDFPQTANAAWFNQSAYGAMFWTATKWLRTFRYVTLGPWQPRYGMGPAWIYPQGQ